MNDLNTILPIIQQLQSIGINLAHTLTPIALQVARLSAINMVIMQSLSCFIAPIVTVVFFMCVNCDLKLRLSVAEYVNLFSYKAIWTLIILATILNIVIVISDDFIINIYGIFHPDVYLAYQALQPIIGH